MDFVWIIDVESVGVRKCQACFWLCYIEVDKRVHVSVCIAVFFFFYIYMTLLQLKVE